MLKSTIPFANIPFFDDVPTVSKLELRFSKFLKHLRDRRETVRLMEAKAEGRSDDTLDLFPSCLSSEDKLRIANRAVNYVDRLDAATGMQHLKTDDRKALRRLKDGVAVSRVPTEHDADVLAAPLHEEMPWMGPATEHIWHALRKSVREDLPGLTDALLPLLERMTAATWQCPYYRVKFDLSRVGWVLTANSLHGLPEPLLSRCPPLDLSPVSKQHLIGFARRLGRASELPDEAVVAIEEIISMCRGDMGGPSLRTVKRMIERAEIATTRPILH